MSGSPRTSYFEAAIMILEQASKPLTTREVTDAAIHDGLLKPKGKTPEATMSAALYMKLPTDPRLGNWRVLAPSERSVARFAGRFEVVDVLKNTDANRLSKPSRRSLTSIAHDRAASSFKAIASGCG